MPDELAGFKVEKSVLQRDDLLLRPEEPVLDLERPDLHDVMFRRPHRRPVLLAVVLSGLMLALAGGYLFLQRQTAQVTPSAAANRTPAASSRPAETEEQIPLPPLDETDALVRQLVSRLSSHPRVAAWLTTDGLLLNFVVVTTAIADGKSPAVELKAIGPVPRFRVRTAANGLYMDPSSYRRYDGYAEAVSALDAGGVARLYAAVKPRVLDASRRVGRSDFDAVLERAIVELLEVPIIDGAVSLEPIGIVYGFADPRLQGLSPAQKQLLRMGPQNVRLVQGKLREVAAQLGIPASRLVSAE